ncbi:hypothetical protein Tco_0243394 [Tanacetum coccineum]
MMDILQNTNFFSAFTASPDVPSNYIQLFQNTLTKDTKNALGITPKDSAHPFVAPPDGDLVIDFVNNLGYPKELHFVSNMYVNSLYQPWRFILTMINQCLTEYYEKYLKMATRKPRQPMIVTDEEGGKKKKAPQTDEENEEDQLASQPQVEDDEYNLQIGIQMSLESLQAHGKGKGIATDEQAAHLLLDLQNPKKKSTTNQYIFQRWSTKNQDASTGPSAQPQDDTSANVVHDTSSPADAETSADTKKSNNKADTEILNVGKEQGGDVSNTVDLEERTVKLDEGPAGSDLGKTPKSRPPLEEDQAGSNPGQSHAVQARPNLEPMHEDFLTTVYPQVHESLKLTTEEYIHIENPPSSFGTLSSMNNLDDAFTFGDQFLNDKSSEDEPRKTNVETEVESMVTILIHQASSSGPPLSTPIIDLTPPKPVSPPVQAPTITSTTATTTTTLLLPSPLPQQSTTDHELATRVSTLEKICANFEKKNKLQDKTNRALSSRVYTLENHDLYSKIDKYVNEVVKEAVHNALQAPLYERFRDLFKFDMK